MVFGVTAEGPIVGGNEQLSLATDSRALQVTWLIGDADVISYTGDFRHIEMNVLIFFPWKTVKSSLGPTIQRNQRVANHFKCA